jgi:localization factor PodJL
MTASVPWSVNAVEPDTWATAREAARRSGLSVGEWLEAAIRDTAGEREAARAPTPRRPGNDHLERRLDDISEQLDHFMQREPRARGKRGGREENVLVHSFDALTQRIETLIGDVRANDQGAPHQIKTAIDRLDHRLETLFSQNRSGASAREPEIERKLSDIAGAIEAMSRRIEQENTRYVAPSASPSIAELDAAIAEITVRQAALDQGVRGGDLERRLAAIDARFGLGHRAGPDLAGLEHQLKTMADEMQALRRASVQAESIETVRREVAELARTLSELAPRRSIETLERTIEALARRIDRASLGAADESASEIIDALKEIRGALADVRPAENFSAVERDLQALSGKLDQLNARGIDGATVDRLQAQTGEIRELLANALPGDALKTLVGQIEMLVHKFEHAASPGEGAVLDVVSALGRRIDTFAERVESAARQPAGSAVLEDIRNRLEQIEGALERGDRGEPGGLEATMKSLVDKLAAAEMKLASIGNLERGLNDLFGQIHEVRANAIDVAERAMRSSSPPLSPSSSPSPADAATRFAEIQERRLTEPEVKPALAPRPPEAKQEPASPPRAPAVRAVPRPIAGDPETASVTSASEEGGDYPLEPGTGAPHPRGAQSAAQRIAQSEAALGGIVSKLPESSTRTSDFIAAARRAAQAAAAEQNFPASAQKDAKTKVAGKPGRMRALFIGLITMLILFGAVRFSGMWMPLFFHAEPSAPPVESPKAEPESGPVEKQSAMPSNQDPAIASAPPSGVVGAAPSSSLLAKPEADPEPTGSIKNAKPANAPVETAAVPARAPAELPGSIGTAALRAAAMAADPVAAYEVGSRWFEGRGVQTNTIEARRWFEIALSRGSAAAAYRLGNIYEKGYGTAKNSAEARRYYAIAAEAGHAKAMHNLAVLYSEGVDGKPDYKTAARWFRMAADRNVRDSQYNLGVLYARGFGVDQNMAESFRWFALAASQGDTDAAKKRDDVAGRLDAQTLTAAKLAVQTWSATPLDDAANNTRLKPEWVKAEAAAPRKRSVKN